MSGHCFMRNRPPGAISSAEFIEAVIHRMEREVVTQMPFAAEGGPVTGLPEQIDEGQFVWRDTPCPALPHVRLPLFAEHG